MEPAAVGLAGFLTGSNMLPPIVKPIREKFEELLAQSNCFDYYGMERGGHFAVLRWALAACPPPAVALLRCSTHRPGLMWGHPGGWFRSGGAAPKSAGLVYGADVDIEDTPSRITDGRKVVLCVRDIRNMLSSRLRWNRRRRWQFQVSRAATATWKKYAEHAVGDRNYFNCPSLSIVYDKWFTSSDYRAEIAAKAGTVFGWDWKDTGLPDVVPLAQGSSFDELKFKDKPQQMQVTNRWKDIEDENFVNELLTSEILALNERLINGVQ